MTLGVIMGIKGLKKVPISLYDVQSVYISSYLFYQKFDVGIHF